MTKCPELKYDPRFSMLTEKDLFSISEWDLMSQNGVIEILEDLHRKYPDISRNPIGKESNYVSLGVRNTIPWKLECEIEKGKDREFGVD